MRIKKGFEIRQLANISVVVKTDQAKEKAVFTLNDTGTFLWDLLRQGTEEEALLAAFLREYEVEREEARTDIREYINTLSAMGVLDT